MSQLTRLLWNALCGGILSVGMLRLMFALTAASAPDPGTGRTAAANFLTLPLYLTDRQFTLLSLMTALVIALAVAWGIAKALSLTTPFAQEQ